MSHPVTNHLNEIAQAAKHGDASKASTAIRAARAAIQNVGARSPRPGEETSPLQILDSELSTWESKLTVIMQEPAGRQGMARHAEHWVKRLE